MKRTSGTSVVQTLYINCSISKRLPLKVYIKIKMAPSCVLNLVKLRLFQNLGIRDSLSKSVNPVTLMRPLKIIKIKTRYESVVD